MESHVLPHTISPWVISLHLCISSNLSLIHNVSNIPFYASSWGDVGHIWDIWSLIHHRASTGTCHTTKYICQRHISNQHGILPQPLFSSLLENKFRSKVLRLVCPRHLYSEGGESPAKPNISKWSRMIDWCPVEPGVVAEVGKGFPRGTRWDQSGKLVQIGPNLGITAN